MIKIVDLFSGAGGLTYGFLNKISNSEFIERTNVEIVFANEFDTNAAASFKQNFPNVRMINQDIKKIDGDYLSSVGIEFETTDIDLIIGGPPCQSYSSLGKRTNDDRSRMYNEFIRMLNLFTPKVFVFENVVGLLSMKNENGEKIINNIEDAFSNNGYSIQYRVINSADFGVPQNRQRVFILGIRKDIQIDYTFDVEKIQGYSALHTTLSDAISDLPKVIMGEEKKKYSENPKTIYQRMMRRKAADLLEHKSYTVTERLFEIIKLLGEGESKVHINKKVLAGEIDEKYYLTSGFSNTYGRLWWNKPSVTLTNNFTSISSMRCAHPFQDRTLTIREGARIQSFPDDFIFVGSKTDKTKQIGNAVPPVLASYLADEIYKIIDKI